MDENHQDKTGSDLIATEIRPWLPPLSPKEQEKQDQIWQQQKSWWNKVRSGLGWLRQKRQSHPVVAILVSGGSALGIALIIVIILGYIFNWSWIGVGSYTPPTKDSNFQRAKTLWDWLQLLIIPLMLAIGGFWLNQLQKRREEQTTEQRATLERELARNNQEETLLQAYIDKISELILKEHLGERTADGKLTPECEKARNVARVRTLTVLTQLDARRIGYVFTFLREAGLMSTTSDNGVVILKNADLRAVKWEQVDLSFANLGQANLSGANLEGAQLWKANLSGAHLEGANLRGAFLMGATLNGAFLIGADLSEACLSGACLEEADLERANLSKAILYETILYEANLCGACLEGARLEGARLEGARLEVANLRDACLRDATLNGAFLIGADLRGADLSGATREPVMVKSYARTRPQLHTITSKKTARSLFQLNGEKSFRLLSQRAHSLHFYHAHESNHKSSCN